ncbi:MAG: heavy metal translocating P-type ATPase, partial [Mariprofundaceae bacterium]|nr:heavy metal translocating P-type ATPase [Mariprofundaceae bacterium]
QDLADRIAPYFVGVTLSLACLTFLYWFSIDINTALLAATAVLIITCPCALGLATPMAIAVSTGLAAKHGVLIRNGKALEKLAEISHVVMDKTGTLTEGSITVSNILFADDQNYALQLAGSIERYDSHPIAKAICASQEAKELGFFDAHNLKMLAGLGIQGLVQAPHADCEVWVGNKRFIQNHGIILTKEQLGACHRIEQDMGIAIFIAADGKLLGLLQLEDKLRKGAHHLISHLAQSNISMTILTGDSIAAASYLEKELSQNTPLNIQVIAEVLPENKAAEVSLLQQQGEHVLMIGDGVNDAPALAQADISIAMGTGTDVSMECSDIVLMGGELQNIPWALALGRRTLKSIRQNLMFSLAYNIVLVPTAMVAWITPVFAALAMPLSSLVVIGNAILIRRHMRK